MTGGAGSGARLAGCPGFGITWAASTVSSFGNYLTSLTVGVLVVLTLDGGATEVGLVNAARWFPYLLVGLVVGVLVDRARRRPLLVSTDLARGLLLCAIPLLAWIDRLNVVQVIVLIAVFGLMSPVHDAAFQAFVPRLVPPGLLTPAHARLDQSDAVAQASAPALAGGLVSLVGAPWAPLAVLVDAASFLFSGLLLWRVRVPEPPPRRVSMRGVPGEVAEGLRWVYRHATLGALAVTTHGWFFFSAIAGAVVTPFALVTLRLSPFGLGLAVALAGVGALVGSLAAVRLGRRFGAGRVVIGCHATTAFARALVALSTDDWSGWALFGAGQLVFGLGLGVSNANANEMGYRQTSTRTACRGG